MLPPRISDLLEAIGASEAPEGVGTKVVAIDGHGGSGKSSLAALLSPKLDAPVVHTDDFASWDNPVDWWPELIEKVLEPLAAGRSASYRPTSWGGPERESVVIEPADVVLIEGVTASRESFRPHLAYSIWIETPSELRLTRGLKRDGDEALDDWSRWMAEEDAYVERERPTEHADVVLPGDADLWS
jgi:uridine kinase